MTNPSRKEMAFGFVDGLFRAGTTVYARARARKLGTPTPRRRTTMQDTHRITFGLVQSDEYLCMR